MTVKEKLPQKPVQYSCGSLQAVFVQYGLEARGLFSSREPGWARTNVSQVDPILLCSRSSKSRRNVHGSENSGNWPQPNVAAYLGELHQVLWECADWHLGDRWHQQGSVYAEQKIRLNINLKILLAVVLHFNYLSAFSNLLERWVKINTGKFGCAAWYHIVWYIILFSFQEFGWWGLQHFPSSGIRTTFEIAETLPHSYIVK